MGILHACGYTGIVAIVEHYCHKNEAMHIRSYGVQISVSRDKSNGKPRSLSI